jgi:uncharacterized protein YlzI (FlbEa/FlbD family)
VIRLTGMQGDPVWVDERLIAAIVHVFGQGPKQGQVGNHRAAIVDRPRRVQTAVMLTNGLQVNVRETADEVAVTMGEAVPSGLIHDPKG